MPIATEILEGLTAIANSWQSLAVLWHLFFGLLAVSVALGWRPANRLMGALLVPALVSVSILAWVEGNPFNGTVFGVLSLAFLGILPKLSDTPVRRSSPGWVVSGILLFAFGWTYPHFLSEGSDLVYLYAAPLGLVPCPTLSMLVGVTLIFGGFKSPMWSSLLVVAALFYGFFGALYLGVVIDWVLTAGGIVLLLLLVRQATGTNTHAA